MPRKPRNADGSNNSPVPSTKKEERYLACSVCDMSQALMLSPAEDRPMHRCQPVYKAMPFDVDLPAHKAPKNTIPWWNQKAKHPRPPTGDTRPRIVL